MSIKLPVPLYEPQIINPFLNSIISIMKKRRNFSQWWNPYTLIVSLVKNIFLYNIQGGPKKSLSCYLEEKFLRNSEIFFHGVFLSICSHLLKKLELSKLCRRKVMGLYKSWKWLVPKKAPYQKRDIFFCYFSISVTR